MGNNKIKVRLKCTYQNHLLIENEIFEKKTGYKLLTSCNSGRNKNIFLLSRGWINKNKIIKIKNLPKKIHVICDKHSFILPFEINQHSIEVRKKKNILFF